MLLDEQGGALRARHAVRYLADSLGSRALAVDVREIRPAGSGLLVRTSGRWWRCGRVLICAGAATPRLAASAGLELPPMTFEWQARPSFRVRGGHGGPLAALIDGSAGVYGSPVGTSGRYAVGVSGSTGKERLTDPRTPPDAVTVAATVRRLRRYVADAMPGLDPDPESVRLCLSSELPEGGDSFGAWQAGGLTAFAGANLFKFAPVLGERLADAVLEDAVPAELRPREVAPVRGSA